MLLPQAADAFRIIGRRGYGSPPSRGRRPHVGRGHRKAYALTPRALDLHDAMPLLGSETARKHSAHPGANRRMGPLEGVKIIDLTTVLMGPYATQMLGDYGADVIKIETLDGDVTRQIGPTRHPGMGPVFLNTNRSKRSICLDLKKPKGRDAVLRRIAAADGLVYNVRPQEIASRLLGYDAVAKVIPRLVCG